MKASYSHVCKAACAIAGLLALSLASTAQANSVTLSFFNITDNEPVDAATEGQYSVTVFDDAQSSLAGAGQVEFKFDNAGPVASSITDVYFDDDGLLSSIASIQSGPGTDFSAGAAPPNLPGGNNDISPPFQTTFSADSNPPVQPNGINPGETMSIVFNLQGGQTFADVVADLMPDGSLRIGIHVQGFPDDGSESFVNKPIPLPAAVWLFGSGLLGLVGIGRLKGIRPTARPPMLA